MVFVVGEHRVVGGGASRGAVVALGARGQEIWRQEFAEEAGGFHVGAMATPLSLSGQGVDALAYFIAHRESRAQGELRIIEAATGRLIWSAPSGSFYGDNRDLWCPDLDSDGEREVLAGFADRLCCFRASDGAAKWTYDKNVAICWGASAVADFDGHGRLEILKSEIDLVGQTGLPLPRYWLAGWPVMCDLDGDGALEAAVSVGNPSGYGRRPGEVPWGDIYLVRADGTIAWKTTLRDWSLCALPFDLDADGRIELLLTCGDGLVRLFSAGWSK